jgi:fibronectin type 3 domain-containing protein
MLRWARISALIALVLLAACSEDKPTSPRTGTLSGEVTLDGIAASGVEIIVSSYTTSGKQGLPRPAQSMKIAGGSYSFVLNPGIYRADYSWHGENEMISTARYPISIVADQEAVVNVELKDPVPHCFLAVDGDAAVELSWESAYGAQFYRLYRAVSADADFQIIAEVDTSTGAVFYTDQPQTVQTYYYRVTSVNGEGVESGYEAVKQVDFTGAIKPPIGLKAVDLVEYVNLSWDSKTRAVYYHIYRKKSDQAAWTVIDSTAVNSYDDTPAEIAIYYYQITARSLYGTESAPGNIVSVDFDGRFDPPQGLTIIDRGSNLYLNWQDYSNAAYYSIYRSRFPDSGFAKIDTCTASYYADVPVDTGIYYYYVTVTGPNGLESEPSLTVNSFFDHVLDYPAGFNSVNRGLYVELSWQEVLWAGGYRLYRSGDGNIYDQIGRTNGASYADAPTLAGLYYYRIATETDIGVRGELSDPVAVQFTNNLLPPTGIVAHNNGTSIQLTWDVVEGVAGHEIYRSGSGSNYEFIDSALAEYYDDAPEAAGPYYYKLKAFDSSGHISAFSNAAYVYFDDYPLPPDSVLAVDLIYRVYVQWASIDTDGLFLIYRNNNIGGYYNFIDTAYGLSFIDWPPQAGYYYYKVRVIVHDDTSDFSQPASLFFTGVLDPPSDLTGLDAGTHIHLSWNAPAGASHYQVYRKHSDDPDYAYQLIMTVYESSADDAPEAAGIYFYKVKALTRGDLESAFAGPVQIYFEP